LAGTSRTGRTIASTGCPPTEPVWRDDISTRVLHVPGDSRGAGPFGQGHPEEIGGRSACPQPTQNLASGAFRAPHAGHSTTIQSTTEIRVIHNNLTELTKSNIWTDGIAHGHRRRIAMNQLRDVSKWLPSIGLANPDQKTHPHRLTCGSASHRLPVYRCRIPLGSDGGYRSTQLAQVVPPPHLSTSLSLLRTIRMMTSISAGVRSGSAFNTSSISLEVVLYF
jgi:hypothetical protein